MPVHGRRPTATGSNGWCPGIGGRAAGAIAALINVAVLAAAVLFLTASPSAAQCYSNGPGFAGSCIASAAPPAGGTAVGNMARASGYDATAFGDFAYAFYDSSTAVGHASAAYDLGTSVGESAGRAGMDQGITSLGANSNSTAGGTVGQWSTAIGAGAVGAGPMSTGSYSVAIGGADGFFGTGAVSGGRASVAIGLSSSSAGASSIALGNSANASNANSVAVGNAVTASGANAFAAGNNSQATGDSGIAIGNGAAAGTGANAIAIGTGAVSTGSIAIGAGSGAALGNTAVGDGATANAAAGSSAFGNGATASALNTTAIGQASVASATGATALGNGASAGFANSTAIGTGATTTAPNQVAIGTAGNTYRMSGVTSAASLAAQSGPVSFVTSDAAGNLATSSFSPSAVSSLQSQVSSLQSQVFDNRLEARTGTAVALAAGSMPSLQPGRKFALSAGYGNFEGANAFAVGATALLYDSKSFAVVANAGGGIGLERNLAGGRGAVSVQW
jgi:trimeric autotransporter adhesin